MVRKDILGMSIVCAFTLVAGMVLLGFTVGPMIGAVIGLMAGVIYCTDRRNVRKKR